MNAHPLIPRNALLGAGLLVGFGAVFAAAAPTRAAARLEIEVGATSMARGLVEVQPSEFGEAWFRFVQDADGRTLTWHSNGLALVRIAPVTRTPDRIVSADGETLVPLAGLRRSELVSDGRWFAFDYESLGPRGPRKSTHHTDGAARIDVHHD